MSSDPARRVPKENKPHSREGGGGAGEAAEIEHAIHETLVSEVIPTAYPQTNKQKQT